MDLTVDYINDNSDVKSQSSEGAVRLALGYGGQPFDLHMVDGNNITVKIGNNDGYIGDIDVDISNLDDDQKYRGSFSFPLSDPAIKQLSPGIYYLEVWINMTDANKQIKQLIFPSVGTVPFTLTPNIVDGSNSVPMITFDRVRQAWDDFKDFMVHNQAQVEDDIATMDYLTGSFEDKVNSGVAGYTNFADSAMSSINSVADEGSAEIGTALSSADSNVAGINSKIDSANTQINTAANGVYSVVNSNVNSAERAIGQVTASASSNTGSNVNSAEYIINNAANGVVNTVNGTVNSAMTRIDNAADGIRGQVNGIVSSGDNRINNTAAGIEKITSSAVSNASSVSTHLNSVASSAVNNVDFTVNSAKNNISAFANDIDDRTSSADAHIDNDVSNADNHADSTMNSVDAHADQDVSLADSHMDSTMNSADNHMSNFANDINDRTSSADVHIDTDVSNADNHIDSTMNSADTHMSNFADDINDRTSSADVHIDTDVSNADNHIDNGVANANNHIDSKVSSADDHIGSNVTSGENQISGDVTNGESTINNTVNSADDNINANANNNVSVVNSTVSSADSSISNNVSTGNSQVSDTVVSANSDITSHVDSGNGYITDTANSAVDHINNDTKNVDNHMNSLNDDINTKTSSMDDYADNKVSSANTNIDQHISNGNTFITNKVADGENNINNNVSYADSSVKSYVNSETDYVTTTVNDAITHTNSNVSHIDTHISNADSHIDNGVTNADTHIDSRASSADSHVGSNVSSGEARISNDVTTGESNVDNTVNSADININSTGNHWNKTITDTAESAVNHTDADMNSIDTHMDSLSRANDSMTSNAMSNVSSNAASVTNMAHNYSVNINNQAESAYNSLNASGISAYNEILDSAKNAYKGINDSASSAYATIQGSNTSASSAISADTESGLNRINSLRNSADSSLEYEINNTGATIKSYVTDNVTRNIKGSVSDLTSSVGADVNNMSGELNNLNSTAETQVAASAAHTSLNTVVSSVADATSELATAIGSNAGSQISSLAAQVSNFNDHTGSSLAQGISNNSAAIGNLSESANSTIINGLNQANAHADNKADSAIHQADIDMTVNRDSSTARADNLQSQITQNKNDILDIKPKVLTSGDANNLTNNGTYKVNSNNFNLHGLNFWYFVMYVSHDDHNDIYQRVISYDNESNPQIYIRSYMVDRGNSWSNWKNIADSDNINNLQDQINQNANQASQAVTNTLNQANVDISNAKNEAISVANSENGDLQNQINDNNSGIWSYASSAANSASNNYNDLTNKINSRPAWDDDKANSLATDTLNQANAYTNNKIDNIHVSNGVDSNYVNQIASSAETSAVNAAKGYANWGDNDTLASAYSYTDSQVANIHVSGGGTNNAKVITGNANLDNITQEGLYKISQSSIIVNGVPMPMPVKNVVLRVYTNSSNDIIQILINNAKDMTIFQRIYAQSNSKWSGWHALATDAYVGDMMRMETQQTKTAFDQAKKDVSSAANSYTDSKVANVHVDPSNGVSTSYVDSKTSSANAYTDDKIKTLMNHIPASSNQATANLKTDWGSDDFNNLEDGMYVVSSIKNMQNAPFSGYSYNEEDSNTPNVNDTYFMEQYTHLGNGIQILVCVTDSGQWIRGLSMMSSPGDWLAIPTMKNVTDAISKIHNGSDDSGYSIPSNVQWAIDDAKKTTKSIDKKYTNQQCNNVKSQMQDLIKTTFNQSGQGGTTDNFQKDFTGQSIDPDYVIDLNTYLTAGIYRYPNEDMDPEVSPLPDNLLTKYAGDFILVVKNNDDNLTTQTLYVQGRDPKSNTYEPIVLYRQNNYYGKDHWSDWSRVSLYQTASDESDAKQKSQQNPGIMFLCPAE